MLIRPCQCVSSRTAAFIAGTVNLFLGMVGLSLFALNPIERHLVLDPLQQVDLKTLEYDTVGDTLQLFIEYLLPAVGIFLLGFVLIIASATMNNCMVVFSFLLSTILMTGCVAGLLSLTISGVDLLGAVPLILVAGLQIYIYWIVIDFNQFSWELPKEDKQALVDSRV